MGRSHHSCGGRSLNDNCRRVRSQWPATLATVFKTSRTVYNPRPALPVVAGWVSLGNQACEQHTDDNET